MANYEFKCDKCRTIYEYIDFKNEAERKRPCPKCKHMNPKRMTAAAIVLKRGGVGWGKDGYNAERSLADGPEPASGDRHKRSGKTVVPVSNNIALQGSKGEKDGDKKSKLMVK